MDKARIVMEQLINLKWVVNQLDVEHGVRFDGLLVDPIKADSCRHSTPGHIAFDLIRLEGENHMVWAAITLDTVRLFLVTTVTAIQEVAAERTHLRLEQMLFPVVLFSDGRVRRYTEQDAIALFTEEEEDQAREIAAFLKALD